MRPGLIMMEHLTPSCCMVVKHSFIFVAPIDGTPKKNTRMLSVGLSLCLYSNGTARLLFLLTICVKGDGNSLKKAV
jgi:hypothetical protein